MLSVRDRYLFDLGSSRGGDYLFCVVPSGSQSQWNGARMQYFVYFPDRSSGPIGPGSGSCPDSGYPAQPDSARQLIRQTGPKLDWHSARS